ncbi:MAG TPA: hypothetical protein PKA05_00485 [Roseiflexaceae bacterium]|nr:hypothetical protein [Roseiflexaceae bacterium]HMP38832.1 hypothetical protein [Roseiflexaceae bacterium]
MPSNSDEPVAPPLLLAYVAALLEQRRHIVRIYDLAIRGSTSGTDRFASLRLYKPQVILLAGTDARAAATIESELITCGATILHLQADVRASGTIVSLAHMVQVLARGADGVNEQKVMIEALVAIDESLDNLPFPARHLLPLEKYPLITLDRELQTPIVIGRFLPGGRSELRHPMQIVAELRSIASEHGIWHFQFIGPDLTLDPGWTRNLLHLLTTARTGAAWEAGVAYDALTYDLLQLYRQAGCEGVLVRFDALDVLADRDQRDRLQHAIQSAHAAGIKVRAQIGLETRYSSMPVLVDLSATFGLDDVQFAVESIAAPAATAGSQPEIESIAMLARQQYHTSRGRQYFVNRFGGYLGPILWRIGRTGMLGTTLRQIAAGGEWPDQITIEQQQRPTA